MFEVIVDVIFHGAVVWLILDRFFFPKEDKVARIGIVELAKEFNKEVHFYDFIKEAHVYTKSFEVLRKEMEEKRELFDELKRCFRKEIEAGDRAVIEGVNTLAKHLGVRLESFHKPEEVGIKVVSLKKEKSKK